MTDESKSADENVPGPEENGRWYKIGSFLLKNPTFALTLSYVYITAVGLVYSAVLYGSFGINILDYSEIADFLLAAFKNPITLFYSGFGFFGAAYFLFAARFLRRRALQYGSLAKLRSFALMTNLLLLAWALSSLSLFPYVTGSSKADSIKNGENLEVRVQYRSFKGSAGQVAVPGLRFIGATQKTVFFYDVDDKRTIVIPQAQLVSIEVPE